MDFAHFDPKWLHLCPDINREDTGMSHTNPPEPTTREMPEPLQTFTQANDL